MDQMISAMEELTKQVQNLAAPSVAAMQNPAASNRQRSGRNTFRAQCFNCGETGHLARSCPNQRHRCRISYLMGCGYQEIEFSYQEILPGISRAFRK